MRHLQAYDPFACELLSRMTGGAGWQYDETTGGFYANNAEAYQVGF